MTAPSPRACDSSIPPELVTAPGACSAPGACRHPPAACSAALRLFSASATCSVAIKPPQPGKPSSPPAPESNRACVKSSTPESNHACVKTLQGPVRCSFSILFGFSFQSRFMPKTCAMVKHGDAVFFFATPEGTSGALGTGRSRAVARTTFFFGDLRKSNRQQWATQRENIRQAVEAGSRARDTDDGSRVLGLRRGRGAYALLQRADGGALLGLGRPTSACSGRARPTTCYCRTGSGA